MLEMQKATLALFRLPEQVIFTQLALPGIYDYSPVRQKI